MHSTQPLTFRHASFHGQIGVARADITPPVGIYARNWGAAKHDKASAIHRPLTLTALTLAPSTGGKPLVLIDVDLGWWKSPQTFKDFQTRLLREVAAESGELIFALSHTHSAPPLMDTDDSLPGGRLHRAWMEELFESTVSTIRRSLNSQFLGTITWQAGRCGLAANRDLPDPDVHKKRVVCGHNPDGATDDMLLVGRVTDATGAIRATIVNYACHPTTLAWDNTAISPDYVGAMRDVVQQGTYAPAVFLLGACGELAPRNQYVGDPAIADKHGKQLGFAALATLHDMEPPDVQLSFSEVVESGAPLAVWKHEAIEPSLHLRSFQKTVVLPLKNWPSAEELERQRADCTDRTFEERLRRKRNVRLGVGDGSTFGLTINIWRIGDAVLVGSSCEAYSFLQQELRRRFPDKTILCMNLINGSIGYLPPAELYETDLYAVWQTPFDRGSLELVVEAMAQAIYDILID